MANQNPQNTAKLNIIEFDEQFFQNSLKNDFALFINSDQKIVFGPYNMGDISILEAKRHSIKINGPLETTDTIYTKNINTESTTSDIIHSQSVHFDNTDTVQLKSYNIDSHRIETDILISKSNILEHIDSKDITTHNFESTTKSDFNKVNIKDASIKKIFVDQSHIQDLDINNLNASNSISEKMDINTELNVFGHTTLSNTLVSKINVSNELNMLNSFLQFSTDDNQINSNLNLNTQDDNQELHFYWGNTNENGLRFIKTIDADLSISLSNTTSNQPILYLSHQGELSVEKIKVENMEVSGTLTLFNEINQISDINEKKDINQINNALEKIKNIHGYTFSMKKDMSSKERCGVIAQEVKEFIPQVVFQNKENEHLSVSYGGLVGVLIECIHELSSRIEHLEKNINS